MDLLVSACSVVKMGVGEQLIVVHALAQHETPQQIFLINQSTWREKTFMSSYFQEGDWQVRLPCRLLL